MHKRPDTVEFMLEELELSQIQDEGARQVIIGLLNLVERLSADLREAQQENQRLRDGIGQRKGEKGKPQIPPNASCGNRKYSSEQERKKPHAPGAESQAPKQERVRIDREEILQVDPARLPEDAQFKGYAEVLVQEVIVQTDNVRYHKEKFYSPSRQQTFLAEMPAGYQGQFGPHLKASVGVRYCVTQVSEPKIVEWLASAGILISAAEVSNLLIKHHEPLHEEKAAIVRAGLASSPWQQTDDTGTRVNGVNAHCPMLCNPLYTAFFTRQRKDRLSVIDALANQQPRRYLVHEQALAALQERHVSPWLLKQGEQLQSAAIRNAEGFEHALREKVGPLSARQKKILKDGARVAAYRAEEALAVVKLLGCDEAGQSKGSTEEVSLCWVHEGRHDQKLLPLVEHHKKLLAGFRHPYWDYYRELLKYKEQPTPEEAARLGQRFEELFGTTTGSEALDERIAKTRKNNVGWLAVLRHPEVPLHNNASELGARARVRKRAVSFGPRTEEGTRAWDTGMTIVATAKKLGVSVYEYLKDRLSGARQMPSLAETIREKAKQLHLGASWDSNSVSPNF